MSSRRPFEYIAVREYESPGDAGERWGQCWGCYVKARVRPLELMTKTRRTAGWTWAVRVFCGWCTAVVLTDEIGLNIPN